MNIKDYKNFPVTTGLILISGIVYLISFVLYALRNLRLGEILNKILNVLGANTFELFLVHIFIDDILMEVYKDYPNQRLVWIIGTLAIVPGVLLLKKCISLVNQIRSAHHVATES